MCAFFFAATLSCCSDRRKSFGPSAPIAYATSVSPPNEAVAWPGCRYPTGDLQEGHGCASRCQFPLFPSTKSRFLCFFGLLNPHFRAFRAQNRGFCAFLPSGTPVFWHFKHKIGIFVRFCLPKPSFSGFSSTKSRFLCAFALRNPRFRAFRAQNRGFCARVAVKCSIGKSNSRHF